jgi:hypothetical protein
MPQFNERPEAQATFTGGANPAVPMGTDPNASELPAPDGANLFTQGCKAIRNIGVGAWIVSLDRPIHPSEACPQLTVMDDGTLPSIVGLISAVPASSDVAVPVGATPVARPYTQFALVFRSAAADGILIDPNLGWSFSLYRLQVRRPASAYLTE